MAQKAFSLFFIMILTVGIVRGGNPLSKYWKLKESNELLEKTVNELKAQNSHLKKEIAKIQHSDTYARKVLRDKYHITDENEQIIFFAD